MTTTDTLAPHRRILAELDAEVKHEEKRLEKMHTEGVDHFRAVSARILRKTGEHDLDSYTREAGALAAMQEGRRL